MASQLCTLHAVGGALADKVVSDGSVCNCIRPWTVRVTCTHVAASWLTWSTVTILQRVLPQPTCCVQPALLQFMQDASVPLRLKDSTLSCILIRFRA